MPEQNDQVTVTEAYSASMAIYGEGVSLYGDITRLYFSVMSVLYTAWALAYTYVQKTEIPLLLSFLSLCFALACLAIPARYQRYMRSNLEVAAAYDKGVKGPASKILDQQQAQTTRFGLQALSLFFLLLMILMWALAFAFSVLSFLNPTAAATS